MEKKQTFYNPYRKNNGSKTDRGRSITDKINEFRKRRGSKPKQSASKTSRPKTSRSFSKRLSSGISSGFSTSRNGERLKSSRRRKSSKAPERGSTPTKNAFFSKLNTMSGTLFGKRSSIDLKSSNRERVANSFSKKSGNIRKNFKFKFAQ